MGRNTEFEGLLLKLCRSFLFNMSISESMCSAGFSGTAGCAVEEFGKIPSSANLRSFSSFAASLL